MLQRDSTGQIITAGMLAILEGRQPEYPASLAPNSLDPDEVLRAASERPREPTIKPYLPDSEPPPAPPKPAPRPKTRGERVRELARQNYSVQEIAQELGQMSVDAWASYCKENGIKTRRGGARGASAERDKLVARLVRAGLDSAIIARRCRCSKVVVMRVVNRLGLRAMYDGFRG